MSETAQDEQKHKKKIEAERIKVEKHIQKSATTRKNVCPNRKSLEGLPVIEVVI
jgi:ribosomal protein L16/L10AE